MISGIRIPEGLISGYGLFDRSRVRIQDDGRDILPKLANRESTLEELLVRCDGKNLYGEFFQVGREEI